MTIMQQLHAAILAQGSKHGQPVSVETPTGFPQGNHEYVVILFVLQKFSVTIHCFFRSVVMFVIQHGIFQTSMMIISVQLFAKI